jgi:nitrite reductase (NADH) large subunit
MDLFGARMDQLPVIWKELVDAGFETGHAYGKSVRTVKSCVGSTWCRYGVQRFGRLRHRHRKPLSRPALAAQAEVRCSGCTRECAEAQSKDVGIIATEKGWNLYVCGNGGMKPRHAELLASDIDSRNADQVRRPLPDVLCPHGGPLQRTSVWRDNMEGGLDYLKAVIINDSLGIAAELEADMAHVVNTYQCEWKSTVNDPEKVKRFRHFINSDEVDSNVEFVQERGQIRPATTAEKKGRIPAVPV